MANLQSVATYSQDITDEVKKITDAITDEIVLTLDAALENRRLIGYGGIFKKKHRENLDEDVDTDLVHTEVDSINNELNYRIERYGWHVGFRNYVKPEEKEQNNIETLTAKVCPN